MAQSAPSRWRHTVFTLAWLVGAAQFAACLVALWLPWGGEHRDPATGSIQPRDGLEVLATPATWGTLGTGTAAAWRILTVALGLAAWVVLALAVLALVVAIVRGRRTRTALTAAAVAAGAAWLALVTRIGVITAGSFTGTGLAIVLVALPGTAVACAVAAAVRPPRSLPDNQHRMLSFPRVAGWGVAASLVAAGLSVWGTVVAAYAVRDGANVQDLTAGNLAAPRTVAGPVQLTARPAWGIDGTLAAVGDGVLVTETDLAQPWSGIGVYEGATGRLRWRVQRLDWQVQQAFEGDRVVVVVADDKEAGQGLAAGYDAWSGRPLWRAQVPANMIQQQQESAFRFAFDAIVANRLILADNAGDGVASYDVATGRLLSTLRPECDVRALAGTASRTYVAEDCTALLGSSPHAPVIAFAAYDGSGRRLWRSTTASVAGLFEGGDNLDIRLAMVDTHLVFGAATLQARPLSLLTMRAIVQADTGTIDSAQTGPSPVDPYAATATTGGLQIGSAAGSAATTLTASTALGQRVWSASVPGSTSSDSIQADGGGLVDVFSGAGSGHYLTVLDARTGHVVASSPALARSCGGAPTGTCPVDTLRVAPGLVVLTTSRVDVFAGRQPGPILVWAAR